MRFCEYLQLQITNNKYYIIDLLSKMKARDSKSVDTKLANLQKAIFLTALTIPRCPLWGLLLVILIHPSLQVNDNV